MPGVNVDGNDVEEVLQAARNAIGAARSGEGPTLIVCETYRLTGHFVGDPCIYRTKEEESEWREKDPVTRYETRLLNEGVLNESKVVELKAAIESEVEQALEYARNSPSPHPEDALRYVYAEDAW